jgi:hypothetical protein
MIFLKNIFTYSFKETAIAKINEGIYDKLK